MTSNKSFYNKNHEKNGKFFSVIRENVLTYFFFLPVVHKALCLIAEVIEHIPGNEQFLQSVSIFTFHGLGFFLKFVKGPLVQVAHVADRCCTVLFGECELLILAQKK